MNPSRPCFPRISALLLSVAAAGLVSGCGRSDASQTAAAAATPEVRIAKAQAGDPSYQLRLPARALPGETARLFPRATGFISERRADIGDRVAAGQVLAVISTPEIGQDVRAEQAAVVQARAAMELARGNHERAEAMVQSQLISREDYSDRLAARDAAAAELHAAEARLAAAREREAYAVVRAPFAGVIAARSVERGDRVVGDSATVTVPLFELNALDPLRIVADVPQSAALLVRPGLQAKVVFPELPGEQFDAEVVRSAQSISGDAGGMRVELRLPNPGERIPAGMIGEIQLQVPRPATVVQVPVSAVLQDAGGARVARLKADSTLEYVPVSLGRNSGEKIEVVDGLKAGDAVVLAPNALLANGTKVKAKSEDAEKS